MEFSNIQDLTAHVNAELGAFCNQFQKYRKDHFHLKRVAQWGILFKYSNPKRPWVINPGGGTELQYHLFFEPKHKEVGYGLGFNMQYVPFKNQQTTVGYMLPYINSYLAQEQLGASLQEKGFYFIYGDTETLRAPKHDDYVLLGKHIYVTEKSGVFTMTEEDFDQLLHDLKKPLFDAYKRIIEYIPKLNQPSSTYSETHVYEPKKSVDIDDLKNTPEDTRDHLQEHKDKMSIGSQAEQIVLEHELAFVQKHFPKQLDKVILVANKPQLGFDILSLDEEGRQKQIEVKAVSHKHGKTSFFITRNELTQSMRYNNYYIYCVSELHSENPKIQQIKNPIFLTDSQFTMKAETYEVELKN